LSIEYLYAGFPPVTETVIVLFEISIPETTGCSEGSTFTVCVAIHSPVLSFTQYTPIPALIVWVVAPVLHS